MKKLFIVATIMLFACPCLSSAQDQICDFSKGLIKTNSKYTSDGSFTKVQYGFRSESDGEGETIVYKKNITDASGFNYKLELRKNPETDQKGTVSTFFKVVISPVYDNNYSGLKCLPLQVWDADGWLGMCDENSNIGFPPQDNDYFITLNLAESTVLLFAGPSYFPEGSKIVMIILKKGDCRVIYNKTSAIDKFYIWSSYYELKVALGDYYSDDESYTPKFGTIRLYRNSDIIDMYDSYPAEEPILIEEIGPKKKFTDQSVPER